MSKVVIYGNGQMAELAYSRYQSFSENEVIGFCVDRVCIKEPTFLGLPLVPFDELEQHWAPDEVKVLVCMGFSKANRLRQERFEEIKARGYRFDNLISPDVVLAQGVDIGENCIIGERVVIQPYSKLGNNINLGSGCVIGHHCELKDHVYLSAGVLISGNVVLEERATLGTGAILRNGITIGEEALIGAGVVMQANALPGAVFASADPLQLPLSSEQYFNLYSGL